MSVAIRRLQMIDSFFNKKETLKELSTIENMTLRLKELKQRT